jgi:hypothetical protein
MATVLYPESGMQFLARMVLATREGHQISGQDARRLGDLAKFGQHGAPTMPEERRQASKPLQPITKQDDLVTG